MMQREMSVRFGSGGTATPGLDVDEIVSLAKAAAWSARYNPERSLDEIADAFRAALAAADSTADQTAESTDSEHK